MPKEKFVNNFKQISKEDVGSCGGKGASLGEMTKAKIPVPPGFVVLASAFDRFLEETDLVKNIETQLNKIDYRKVDSVDRASISIRKLINDVEVPEDIKKEVLSDFKKLGANFVAVRSSATAEDSSAASWAGELESFLNTTEKTLLANIKKCWSSLFTPRAIFYRQEKNMLNTHVSVAVVVQKMIDSEISGIAFTVHPVTQDKNKIIIEAGYGLGEAIVSGSITPDSYIIDKRDYSMTDLNVANQERKIIKGATGGTKWVNIPSKEREQQKLNDKQIVELAKTCASIEKHYKFPCDIEWALEKNKFYIVQSRPITTL